jgi:hypothetical protein
MKLKMFGLSFCLVFLFSIPAWAQSTPMPAPTLTTATVVVTILSLLLGILTQIVQSGSLFGIVTVPKPWLPDFTLASTFIGGLVAYLGGQSSLNSSIVFYAVVAGITALLAGAAPGMAIHAHYVVPAQLRAARKAALAEVVTSPGT